MWSLTIWMNTSFQWEAMKDLNILRRFASRLERENALRLKSQSKSHQSEKTMSLKDFWRFNFKAWHLYLFPSMLNVKFPRFFALKISSRLMKILPSLKSQQKRIKSECHLFLSKIWATLTSPLRSRQSQTKVSVEGPMTLSLKILSTVKLILNFLWTFN